MFFFHQRHVLKSCPNLDLLFVQLSLRHLFYLICVHQYSSHFLSLSFCVSPCIKAITTIILHVTLYKRTKILSASVHVYVHTEEKAKKKKKRDRKRKRKRDKKDGSFLRRTLALYRSYRRHWYYPSWIVVIIELTFDFECFKSHHFHIDNYNYDAKISSNLSYTFNSAIRCSTD